MSVSRKLDIKRSPVLHLPPGRPLLRRPGAGDTFGPAFTLVVVLIVLGLLVGQQNYLLQSAVTISFALAACGLGLAMGFGGEYLLGQGAVFALGAYLTAILTSKHGWNFWLGWAVATAASGSFGIVLSIVGLRVSRFYFAMIGFFVVAEIPDLAQIFSSQTGGSAGLVVPVPPSILGTQLLNRGMFILSVVALLAVLWVFHSMLRGPYGLLVRQMRDSPSVLASQGVAPWRVRTITYAVATAAGGLGGGIYGHLFGYLQPTNFSLTQTILIFAAVLIGGSRNRVGTILGVGVLYFIPQVLIDISGYTDLVYGAIILAGAIATGGGGLQSLGRAAQRRLRGADAIAQPLIAGGGPNRGALSAAEPDALVAQLVGLRPFLVGDNVAEAELLRCAGARKHFAGLAALQFAGGDAVAVVPGRVHVLLGPNGSGKTTLLNAMSRLIDLDDGELLLGEREVSSLPTWALARAGVGRSFQSPVLPNEMTPRGIIAARLNELECPSGWRWALGTPGVHRVRDSALRQADELLAAFGLRDVAHASCRAISSGQRRLVDVLSALTSRSSLMLLDEPAAGLSEDERQVLAGVITRLAGLGMGFLVVEHDLALAMGIATDVTVLDEGRVVERGTPDEVRASVEARRVLLGEEAM